MLESRTLPPAVHSYITENAQYLGQKDSFDPLMKRVGDARVVLLGKDSHGTGDYYNQMAAISQRLIRERDFTTIAIEWDFAETLRINDYIAGTDGRKSARNVLSSFGRFPRWMWGNEEMVEFVEWLKQENVTRKKQKKEPVKLLGLDILNDPKQKLQRQKSNNERDELFYREQELQAASDVAKYQNSNEKDSWDVREYHMHQTLKAILRHKGDEKVIVLAHNAHVGDARATRGGNLSLGQLVRASMGEEKVVLLGMQSYSGTVLAANVMPDHPGHRSQVMQINPEKLPDSWQNTFHTVKPNENYIVVFDAKQTEAPEFRERRSQRAIGVTHNPDKPFSVPTDIFRRYDGIVHFGRSSAATPLTPLE